ncbi:MAG: ABC transporter ATP-binding protein [Gammaproteobacteria bacterium]
MLELRNVSHRYGNHSVLDQVSMQVAAGEIVCLLGASGSGKSTLLRLIAGLESLQSGEIHFDGALLAQPGREPAPETRRFGLVFQDHVLFPHLTIAQNVAFGLTGLDQQEQGARVASQLEKVGLATFAGRYAHTLSGGQQQRVALARALAPGPRLMLLDEPFASVDSTRRRLLREEARLALRDSGVPAIVVTHDADEAMELADRIAVVHAGRIVQYGTPEDVWRKPANRFIAELFGATDAIDAHVQGGQLMSAFGPIDAGDVALTDGDHYAVIARTEAVRLIDDGQSSAHVADIRFLGDQYLVIAAVEGATIRATSRSKPSFDVGQAVAVSFDRDGVLLYNRE